MRFSKVVSALAEAPDRIARLRALAREIVAESFRARGKNPAPEGRIYRGVSLEESGRWSSAFMEKRPGGRVAPVNLGYYARQEDAARAYDRYLLFLGKKNLFRLNFPGEPLEPASAEQLREEAGKHMKFQHTSAYRGVAYADHQFIPGPRWLAQLTDRSTDGVFRADTPKHISAADTEEQAAEYHDRAALWYFKDRAVLNFPEKAPHLIPTPVELIRAERRQNFKATTASRFRGVSKRSVYWYAIGPSTKAERRNIRAESEEEAACIYDALSLVKHGRKAFFNFHPVTRQEICGRRLTDEEWAEFEALRASSLAFGKAS